MIWKRVERDEYTYIHFSQVFNKMGKNRRPWYGYHEEVERMRCALWEPLGVTFFLINIK